MQPRFRESQRIQRRWASLCLLPLLGIALLPGCRQQLSVPPITAQPTGVHQPGKFVWVDLITPDVSSAKAFYGGLFGWEFEGPEGATAPFTLIRQGDTPIGGIVYRESSGAMKQEARWLSYISVPDVDKAAQAALESGGEVFVAPFELPMRGRVAVILDPEKVPVALIQARGGDPADEPITPFRWMWRELWTTDTTRALTFYGTLAGYASAHVTLPGLQEPYLMLTSDGTPRAGMGQLATAGREPLWLPYVNVEDPEAIVAQTLALGGTVLIAPDSTRRSGTVAVIADPTGGILAVQQWKASQHTEGDQK